MPTAFGSDQGHVEPERRLAETDYYDLVTLADNLQSALNAWQDRRLEALRIIRSIAPALYPRGRRFTVTGGQEEMFDPIGELDAIIRYAMTGEEDAGAIDARLADLIEDLRWEADVIEEEAR